MSGTQRKSQTDTMDKQTLLRNAGLASAITANLTHPSFTDAKSLWEAMPHTLRQRVIRCAAKHSIGEAIDRLARLAAKEV